MKEISLYSYVRSLKQRRKQLSSEWANTSFWKFRQNIYLKKEIRRLTILIEAGERYIRHIDPKGLFDPPRED